MLRAYQERQAKLKQEAEPKKSKYNNVKTEVEGILFDSKKEAARWLVLRQMERVGDITDLQRQVKFEIVPKVKIGGKTIRAKHYICDFVYEQNGVKIFEDVKGFANETYLLKKHLMAAIHGIEILET